MKIGSDNEMERTETQWGLQAHSDMHLPMGRVGLCLNVRRGEGSKCGGCNCGIFFFFLMKLDTPVLLQLNATIKSVNISMNTNLKNRNGDGCKLINLALNAHTHVYASWICLAQTTKVHTRMPSVSNPNQHALTHYTPRHKTPLISSI